MKCKDLNLYLYCPQCESYNDNICWMIVWGKDNVLSKKDAVETYLHHNNYFAHSAQYNTVTSKDVLASFYYKEFLKHYYPQYVPDIEKLEALL